MSWLQTSPAAGVYFHIPFCTAICHYCDFAKTARYDNDLLKNYATALRTQLQWIIRHAPEQLSQPLHSVYFGGGTPSVYTTEIGWILEPLAHLIDSTTEITLEANPEHIDAAALAAWKAAGINRISLGIQSFQQQGLKFLTRQHSPDTAYSAAKLCRDWIDKVAIDLIFGWPQQTKELFDQDLSSVFHLHPDSISLYNLTFAPGTVIGRRHQRGVIEAQADDRLIELYHSGRKKLNDRGYRTYEISNFSRSGTPKHNQLYWQMQPYLSLGSGAHGFLHTADSEGIGWRYFFPRQHSLQNFTQTGTVPSSASFAHLKELLTHLGAQEDQRSVSDFLTEWIWTGLRTPLGIDLSVAENALGRAFTPTPQVREGLHQGLLQLSDKRRLSLAPSEYFRESAWSYQVSQCWPLPEPSSP